MRVGPGRPNYLKLTEIFRNIWRKLSFHIRPLKSFYLSPSRTGSEKVSMLSSSLFSTIKFMVFRKYFDCYMFFYLPCLFVPVLGCFSKSLFNTWAFWWKLQLHSFLSHGCSSLCLPPFSVAVAVAFACGCVAGIVRFDRMFAAYMCCVWYILWMLNVPIHSWLRSHHRKIHFVCGLG